MKHHEQPYLAGLCAQLHETPPKSLIRDVLLAEHNIAYVPCYRLDDAFVFDEGFLHVAREDC